MKIDENTKVIGRFHSKVSPRGLNIYNPLFQELGINALFLLFYNPEPKILMDGLRGLNFAGAVTVGFETDSRMKSLVDELDESASNVGKVGFVKNIDGLIKGYYQGGEGMYRTILQTGKINNKKIVIVGAGQVAKSLLYCILKKEKSLPSVEVFNRTVENAQELQKEFNFVKSAQNLNNLKMTSGNILVNVSHIGGREKDELFSEGIVSRFETVVDVTFETENTKLIKLAKKLKKKYATGWDMFTYQGQVVLETILDCKIPAEVLKKYVINGLSEVVK